jgi:hypothetical protein
MKPKEKAILLKITRPECFGDPVGKKTLCYGCPHIDPCCQEYTRRKVEEISGLQKLTKNISNTQKGNTPNTRKVRV